MFCNESRCTLHAHPLHTAPILAASSPPLQADACGPYVEEYGTKRLPKYIDFLEGMLRWNEERPGAPNKEAAGDLAPGYLVGPRLTAADLVAWHYLCALDQHYKKWYEEAISKAPRLAAFKAAIGARPRIVAYLASGRSPPWDDDSLM